METKTNIIIIIVSIRIKNKTQLSSIIDKQTGCGYLKSSLGFTDNGYNEWCNERIIISTTTKLIYWWITSIKACNYTTNSKHAHN